MNFSFAGMNTLADPAGIPLKNGQCVDIVNCWLNDEHQATVRDGFVRVQTGSFTSAWSPDPSGAYVVKEGHLYWFNGSTLANCTQTINGTLGYVALGNIVEFTSVNGMTVFSDGAYIGIADGTMVTRMDDAGQWDLVAATGGLDDWVLHHYPDSLESGTSNFEVDAFKLPVLPGKCLTFFSGALYLARGNFVFCSKTFDVSHMDIRYHVAAGFSAPVTMIAAMNDGLYVGTEDAVYFLAGGGLTADGEGASGEFIQKKVAEVGAMANTLVMVGQTLVPLVQAVEPVALWSTPLGVFCGTTGGIVHNLSQDKVIFPVTGTILPRGSAQFRDTDGIYQYLVSFQGHGWVMNSNTLTFSRYTGWDFAGQFALPSGYYGVSALGLYRLAGNKDFYGEAGEKTVAATIVTPVTDFGVAQKKSLDLASLYGRFHGEAVLDLLCDETEAFTGLIFPDPHAIGMLRVRGKPPKGIAGSSWQFRIRNVAGSRFTLQGLELSTIKRSRR